MLEQGAKAIFGCWYYGSLSAGWSPAIFREVFVPLMKQYADLIHRYGGIYHVYDDGKMMRTIGDYVAGGADVIETLTPPPVGDVDLDGDEDVYITNDGGGNRLLLNDGRGSKTVSDSLPMISPLSTLTLHRRIMCRGA